jgi:hypothetical protein
MDKLPTIFSKEEHEFMRLWHSYHAKHQIPYNHDEAKRFFESVLFIFKEG